MKTKSIIASVLFTVLAGNTYAATNIPAPTNAAQVEDSVFRMVSSALTNAAPDYSDNKGYSMLLEDTSGKLVVAGVSKMAYGVGVRQGAVLESICTQPANIEHYKDLLAVAGKNKNGAYIIAKNILKTGDLISADNLEIKNGWVVTAKDLKVTESSGASVTLTKGTDIEKVCVPVKTSLDVQTVEAAFAPRQAKNGKIIGGWHINEYHFISDKQESAALLSVFNPDQSLKKQ